MKFIKLILMSSALIYSSLSLGMTNLLDIQHRWAHANYELEDDEQIEAFKLIIHDIDEALVSEPEQPNWLIWRGITTSTLAGAEGGLGALSLAESARDDLEKALSIDGNALNGSAYTSLGTLYHNVPGWPLGFGSDKKAKEFFQKALELNPDGIDPNYFYAEFLYNNRKYQAARKYLMKAKQAKSRPDRPLADSGRLNEIDELLRKVNKKLK